MSDTLILNEKVYSKSNRTQQQKFMCITNWGKLVLQIGAVSLLQIGASVVTNWSKIYYKLGQVLQIRAIITNYGRTYKMYVQNVCFISRIIPVTGIELFSSKVFD